MILIDYQALIDAALEARNFSYSPYSTFKVGAALLCSNGKIFTGCNIESAAYSETICAERVAIFKAISQGASGFSAIAIVGGISTPTSYTYPCGSCRQVLSEHCSEELKVVLYDGANIKIQTLGQLFPCSFKKGSIK